MPAVLYVYDNACGTKKKKRGKKRNKSEKIAHYHHISLFTSFLYLLRHFIGKCFLLVKCLYN